jgi:hypothetical protein
VGGSRSSTGGSKEVEFAANPRGRTTERELFCADIREPAYSLEAEAVSASAIAAPIATSRPGFDVEFRRRPVDLNGEPR